MSLRPSITVPIYAIENTADDAVPKFHVKAFLDACASTDKTLRVIKGANHYYAGQDAMLDTVVSGVKTWLQERNLDP